jgi:glyoxylase-like metal-dependent hydrolase (beta-lactamase superfamily II)
MTPEVVGFFHKPTFSVSYLVFDPASRRGLIIDPVLDYDHRSSHTSTGFADALLEDVRRRGIAIDWLLETHIHADHLSAQAYLKEKLGVPTAIVAAAPMVQATFKAIYNLGSEFTPDGSEDPPQSDLTPIPGRSGERSAAASPAFRRSSGRSPVVTRPPSAAPAAGEVWMP